MVMNFSTSTFFKILSIMQSVHYAVAKDKSVQSSTGCIKKKGNRTLMCSRAFNI